jgi:hypothetical protein
MHLHVTALHNHLINMNRLTMTPMQVRDLFENEGVDEGMISNWKQNAAMWNGFMWLRAGTGCGLLWTR